MSLSSVNSLYWHLVCLLWVRFNEGPLEKALYIALHCFAFLLQAKSKELELLCSLKNVEFDPIEQEQSVGKLM